MEQLKFKDLAKLFDELKKEYSVEEILEMPVRRLQVNEKYSYWEFGKRCSETNKEIFID